MAPTYRDGQTSFDIEMQSLYFKVWVPASSLQVHIDKEIAAPNITTLGSLLMHLITRHNISAMGQ